LREENMTITCLRSSIPQYGRMLMGVLWNKKGVSRNESEDTVKKANGGGT